MRNLKISHSNSFFFTFLPPHFQDRFAEPFASSSWSLLHPQCYLSRKILLLTSSSSFLAMLRNHSRGHDSFVGIFCGLSYFWNELAYQLFLTGFAGCVLKENKEQKLWMFREKSNLPCCRQNLLSIPLHCGTAIPLAPAFSQIAAQDVQMLFSFLLSALFSTSSTTSKLWKRNSDVCFQVKNDNPWVTCSSTLMGKL